MQPKRILSTAQTVSDSFYTGGGRCAVTLLTYTSGTWTLEMMSPNGSAWIPLNVTFSKADSIQFYAIPSYKYRLSGGGVGAEAEIVQLGRLQGNPKGA